MKICIEGSLSIFGTPSDILSQMQEARYFDSPKGDGYIQTITADVKRCFEVDLNIQGDTYEERAESLLRELASHNLIKIEEE